jgi:hypothetical protein
LGELGRLVNEPSLPNDIATVNGAATLDSQNNLTLTAVRASALGAEFAGDASLQAFNAYQLRGDLRHLDLANAIRAAGQARVPYDGVLSGPVNIVGNLHTGLRSLTAQAKLSILPGSRGIPLSGNLTAAYSGARDDVSIQKSLLILPHSRLSVDGSVGKQLNVALTTTNLDDLLAVLPQSSRPPIALHGGNGGGQASFTGKVTGGLGAPSISGHINANRFTVAGRQFDSFNADAFATMRGVAVENGSLARNTMQARFSGTLGLRDWKPVPSAPLAINGHPKWRPGRSARTGRPAQQRLFRTTQRQCQRERHAWQSSRRWIASGNQRRDPGPAVRSRAGAAEPDRSAGHRAERVCRVGSGPSEFLRSIPASTRQLYHGPIDCRAAKQPDQFSAAQ